MKSGHDTFCVTEKKKKSTTYNSDPAKMSNVGEHEIRWVTAGLLKAAEPFLNK